MLELTVNLNQKYVTARDFAAELRAASSDEEVRHHLTGAVERMARADMAALWEQTESGLFVPTGMTQESVTATTHYTSAEEGAGLTPEFLQEMMRKLRQASEFRLGGVSLYLDDYDVHDFGDVVVLRRRREGPLFPEWMRKYDIIVFDREGQRTYAFKAPKVEVIDPLWPSGASQKLKAPIWYDGGASLRFIVPRGLGLVIPFYSDPSVEREPVPRWEEYIGLTDAEFFEVYDEVEVPR